MVAPIDAADLMVHIFGGQGVIVLDAVAPRKVYLVQGTAVVIVDCRMWPRKCSTDVVRFLKLATFASTRWSWSILEAFVPTQGRQTCRAGRGALISIPTPPRPRDDPLIHRWGGKSSCSCPYG